MILLCLLLGHNTQGWKRCVDRFLADQWAPDMVVNSAGEMVVIHEHKKVPAWWHFLGVNKAFKWDYQECRCKRCGTLFWEFDAITLKEKRKGA